MWDFQNHKYSFQNASFPNKEKSTSVYQIREAKRIALSNISKSISQNTTPRYNKYLS